MGVDDREKYPIESKPVRVLENHDQKLEILSSVFPIHHGKFRYRTAKFAKARLLYSVFLSNYHNNIIIGCHITFVLDTL
jgi:hypothetical protein